MTTPSKQDVNAMSNLMKALNGDKTALKEQVAHEQQVMADSGHIDVSHGVKTADIKAMENIMNAFNSASNNVSKKSKTKFNVSEQIGQVPIGVSIIDLIYDILIQNIQIRQELTASIDGFSKVVRISPEIIQKKHNPITNIMSHQKFH